MRAETKLTSRASYLCIPVIYPSNGLAKSHSSMSGEGYEEYARPLHERSRSMSRLRPGSQPRPR